MEITIHQGGMQTTVQDLGRTGSRAAGVPLGGAIDAPSLRLANLLVGNEENTPALEMTLVGPEIFFSEDAVVALVGANFPGMARGRTVLVKAGEGLHQSLHEARERGRRPVFENAELDRVADDREKRVLVRAFVDVGRFDAHGDGAEGL